MKVGTKSVLFGVHAFWWHPITVALAWRKRWGKWPTHLSEWVAILCHDVGYWGCDNIDGPCGKDHPWKGAKLAGWVMLKLGRNHWEVAAAMMHVLGHSKSFATNRGFVLSPLYSPDKLSILFDPSWFYLLRATLTGEIDEFMQNGPAHLRQSKWKWLAWYKTKVRNDFYGKAKSETSSCGQ